MKVKLEYVKCQGEGPWHRLKMFKMKETDKIMGRAKSLRRWEWMSYGQKVEQYNRRGERRKVCMQMMTIQRFGGRKLRVFLLFL